MTTYSELVESHAPIGWWKLGSNAFDSSGNGNDGTPVGAVTFGHPGPINDQSAYFDGSTHITTPVAYVNYPLTIIAWVNYTTASEFGMIVAGSSESACE